ncbi:MAG: hypothetical protein AAGB34_00030 [Planctomycetota bacterium]
MLITKDLRGFVEDTQTDTYVVIEGKSLVMRCRKEARPIGGRFMRMVVLSTIEVEPNERGKGRFRDFLDENETIADELGVLLYIEDIVNDNLASHLDRRGWSTMGGQKEGLCMARFTAAAPYLIEPRIVFGATSSLGVRINGGHRASSGVLAVEE